MPIGSSPSTGRSAATSSDPPARTTASAGSPAQSAPARTYGRMDPCAGTATGACPITRSSSRRSTANGLMTRRLPDRADRRKGRSGASTTQPRRVCWEDVAMTQRPAE